MEDLKAYKFMGEFGKDDIFFIKGTDEADAIKTAKEFWGHEVSLIGEISKEDVFWF
jgi:hypothetical protein